MRPALAISALARLKSEAAGVGVLYEDPAAAESWKARAGVFVLPGVPGARDALVADGESAGEPECERDQAHEAAPAAADVVAGGVFDGGS
jgi:hypothetical protein